VALLLWKAGLRRVRPLEGGIEGWRSLGYPLEPVVGAALEDEPGPIAT
jgi:rhodanese-related sulfurtransferase